MEMGALFSSTFSMTFPSRLNDKGQFIPSCLESIIFDTMEEDSYENEPVESKIKRALEFEACSVIKNTPCQEPFEKAFACWIKSTAKWKGSDCYDLQVAVYKCFKAHSDVYPAVKEYMQQGFYS